MLKLTKGWDVARDHALMAVRTDNRMRSWSHDGRTGLLYKCGLGSVDLSTPIGARAPLLPVPSLVPRPGPALVRG